MAGTFPSLSTDQVAAFVELSLRQGSLRGARGFYTSPSKVCGIGC